MKRLKLTESFVNIPLKGVKRLTVCSWVVDLIRILLRAFLVADTNLKLYVVSKGTILPFEELDV